MVHPFRPVLAVLAAAGAALSLAGPARADAPPPVRGYEPRAAPVVHPSRPRFRRHSHRVHAGYRLSGAGPVYGAEPVYYPGAGGASPNAGFGALAPVPVAVSEYREPYIGRGLIYNVPGEPTWSSWRSGGAWRSRGPVISVKN